MEALRIYVAACHRMGSVQVRQSQAAKAKVLMIRCRHRNNRQRRAHLKLQSYNNDRIEDFMKMRIG